MIIRSIEFDKKEQPQTLTVELSVAEAAALAQLTGKRSPLKAAEDKIPYPETTSVYDALVGAFFNRYWDNGIEGYVKDHRG